jgi:predicted nuclease of predicted toxin-antitoxin system
LKFYLDEDLSAHVAEIARSRGLDVTCSHECGRDGWSDEHQLRIAAEEGRCFVTRNRDDFAMLTVRFLEVGAPHAGVLVVSASLRGSRFMQIALALVRYDEQHREGVYAYTFDFLRSGQQ